ncbi:threonine-phosphate decarboxylase CobD [uncultured Selenomonas sp.]|uniref:threonine-phosphate decarboxylase CobD n=1 Tax=uncultured Selenomonas sp. TaxID=159275 RepID=UPI0025DD386C|nr:threonine-phosphate decarboxylase CobD [uncultured Selenomonas sp.]
MTAKRFVHGGNIYDASETGEPWLDFSANINPLGLPHAVVAAIEGHIGDLVHYPDPAARELRAALSAHYETPEDTLVLGNGAAELFYLFFETYRPKRVLLPVPSFSEYERAALAAGADVEYFLLKEKGGFAIDVEALLAEAERTKAEAIVLGNPNNPTGTLVQADALVHLSERLTALGCSLVVDESFLDFRTDEQRFTLRKQAGKLPHLLLVRSLTKFFAMPGLRLGFGIALPALARKLDAHKDVWNVNLLAQAAGVAVLEDYEYQETTRKYLLEAAPAFVRTVAKLPGVLRVLPPCVNFVLVHMKTPGDAARVITGLKKRGILVRNCANFTGLEPGWIRLAVRRLEDNQRLFQAWRDLYAGF